MAENPFGLHVAGPRDAVALLAFVLPIFAEDAAQTVSVAKVEALVKRCVERDSAIAGIVTGPDGAIEASVGATIDTFDYTDEPHAMVRWLGAAPGLRRTAIASRLMSYVRWLYDSLAAQSDIPVPLFLSTLTTAEQRSKVRLYQRRAPTVGALFAFGCLPDRSFLTPSRVGQWSSDSQGHPKGTLPAAPVSGSRADRRTTAA